MGLLEKADQIRSGEESQEAPPAAPTPPPTVVLDPEPVQEAPEAKPKTRRRGRKPRTPRAKKTRQAKTLPAGFEEVTSGQRIIRRVSDFIVSYGWCVPIVGIFAWGSNFDPTYFIILGMLLMSFNLIFMPRSTGRTVGNWISRTTSGWHDGHWNCTPRNTWTSHRLRTSASAKWPRYRSRRVACHLEGDG